MGHVGEVNTDQNLLKFGIHNFYQIKLKYQKIIQIKQTSF